MKIFDPKRNLFLNSRILFTINGCEYCKMYLRFIQRINSRLPLNKRIEVINCTNYHDFDILDDKRIPYFIKYYQGSYPTLFLNGGIIRGANSQEELVAWIKTRLGSEFIIDEEMEIDGVPLTFNRQCRFVQEKWRKRIHCQ